MNESPLVTAIIPVYNREVSVKKAIESVLEQTYQPLEIIVVDDGSKDNTVETLAAFGNKIKVLRHDTNLGPSAARNTGIAAALGDYVAFLDSDDFWSPDKTQRQLDFMNRNDFLLSTTGFSCTYDNYKGVKKKYLPYFSIGLEENLWGMYSAPGSTLIAETSLLRRHGGYNTSYKRLEDWELLLRVTKDVGVMGYLNEDLVMLYPSAGAPLAVVESHCLRLLEDGKKLLKGESARLINKLYAGVYFEIAAAQWKAGHHSKGFATLLKSVCYSPFNHQSIKIMVLPWLKIKLRAMFALKK